MVYVLTNEEADELAHKLTVRLDEVSAERDALAARVKELEAEHKIMWRFALQVSEGLRATIRPGVRFREQTQAGAKRLPEPAPAFFS